MGLYRNRSAWVYIVGFRKWPITVVHAHREGGAWRQSELSWKGHCIVGSKQGGGIHACYRDEPLSYPAGGGFTRGPRRASADVRAHPWIECGIHPHAHSLRPTRPVPCCSRPAAFHHTGSATVANWARGTATRPVSRCVDGTPSRCMMPNQRPGWHSRAAAGRNQGNHSLRASTTAFDLRPGKDRRRGSKLEGLSPNQVPAFLSLGRAHGRY